MNKKTKLLGMLLLTLVCIFAIPTQKAEASTKKIVKSKKHVIVTVTAFKDGETFLVILKNNNKYPVSVKGNINFYEKNGALASQNRLIETVPTRKSISFVTSCYSDFKKIAISINEVHKTQIYNYENPSYLKITKTIKGRNGLTVKFKNIDKKQSHSASYTSIFYNRKGEMIDFCEYSANVRKNGTLTTLFDTYVSYSKAKVFLSDIW